MRDVLVMAIVLLGAVAALRRPWVGVMLWTWVSTMNPHRFTYGFAFSMPVAAIAAAAVLMALFITKDRSSPFKAVPPGILLVFCLWVTLSWIFGMSPGEDYEQWKKVMKIFLMIFVTLMLLHTKSHIMAFVWVAAGSLALLGAKGGVFTIATAGTYRVWGPPGTFIEENNAFAVGVIMTIPLMRFLQMQLQSRWGRTIMTLVMVLLAASALGSQSRGAALALVAMSTVMWWRQKNNKLVIAIVMVVFAVLLVAFMPASWEERMSTIQTYDQDQSAMGRIAAWQVAWRLAFDYPLGVGMLAARPELFFKYSDYLALLDGHVPVAHSIYFQMLGQHGFVGLFLFLSLWISTWWVAAHIRKRAAGIPEAQWCGDLAAMAQVSYVGYFVGGAFLDLAYFDLPYNIMVMLVLCKVWMTSRAWEREPVEKTSRWFVPGLFGPVRREAT
jgi:putative inorganic carbon (hco3(-)) transporter